MRFTAETLGFFRFFFFSSYLLIFFENEGALHIVKFAEFFEPVGFLRLFDSNPFTYPFLAKMAIVERVCFTLAAVGFLTRPATIVAAFLLIIHFTNTHSYNASYFLAIPMVIITFILSFSRAGDAFSIDNLISKKNNPQQESFEYYWPFWLMTLYVSLTYMAACLAKIRLQGTGWFLEDQMQMHLLTAAGSANSTPFTGYFSRLHLNYIIGSLTVFCRISGIFILFIEFFAFIGLFVKKLFWPTFLSLMAFHLVTPIILYINPQYSILALTTWLPWNKIVRFVRRRNKVE